MLSDDCQHSSFLVGFDESEIDRATKLYPEDPTQVGIYQLLMVITLLCPLGLPLRCWDE